MNSLKGQRLELRALEPTDLDVLYQLENDESLWEVSNTSSPYSKFVLKQYLDQAHRDIYEVKQLRLAIQLRDELRVIGLIDLFDFEAKHRRAGIGIVIFRPADRSQGYARESIELLCRYAFTHLQLHQLFANITEDNQNSIALFESLGFVKQGSKKDWIRSSGGYKTEHFYQLIHEES